uniref:Nuclear transport factor 2 n=1 Tax=Paramormyrops kingsleyae TaxID=1676925 RepID=A0A3B3RCL4_9TELE
MGDKPIWEQIGSSFVQHYYQLFDTDRTQLGAIYIDASCLTWEGQQFQGKAAIVEKLSVSQLNPADDMKWGEGCHLDICPTNFLYRPFLFLKSLPFTKIAHSITAQDHQPTPDSCILSMVVGQLKVRGLVDCQYWNMHNLLKNVSVQNCWSLYTHVERACILIFELNADNFSGLTDMLGLYVSVWITPGG